MESIVRVRPQKNQERIEGIEAAVQVQKPDENGKHTCLTLKETSYTFDRVLPPETSQKEAYKSIIGDKIRDEILEGRNATVRSLVASALIIDSLLYSLLMIPTQGSFLWTNWKWENIYFFICSRTSRARSFRC